MTPVLDAVRREELRKRVEVKPLEFTEVEGFKGVFNAPSMLGNYRVDDAFQTPAAEGMKVVLPSWLGPYPAGFRHECTSVDQAKAAAQADYESRILAALLRALPPSNEAAR